MRREAAAFINNCYQKQRMLPCSTVHWKILPAVCSQLAKFMEEMGMPQGRIAARLGITAPAVSQYLSGKRGRKVALNKEACAACSSLAKKLASEGVKEERLDIEISKIVALAKGSRLGNFDPCVICASKVRGA